jgi:hypothetical protein
MRGDEKTRLNALLAIVDPGPGRGRAGGTD